MSNQNRMEFTLDGGGSDPKIPSSRVNTIIDKYRSTETGYYTPPNFGAEYDTLKNDVYVAEGVAKAAAADQVALQEKKHRQEKTLTLMANELKRLRSSGASEETLSKCRTLVEDMLSQYVQTEGSIKQLQPDAQKAFSDYNTAVTAYNAYVEDQQKQYDQWRGTVRDADAITVELSGLDKKDPFSAPKIKQLEEELGWSRYFHYSDLKQANDFAEKSKYKPQTRQKQGLFASATYASGTSGWEDPLYEAVNGNTEAQAWLQNSGAASYGGVGLAAIYGAVADGKTESQQMTEDEIATFNYLYATQGQEAAHVYYEYLSADLYYRQRKEQEAYWAKQARQKPVATSMFSVITSPVKGLSYAGQLGDMLADGELTENAPYNSFTYTNTAIRDQVSKQIQDSGKWGNVGSFAYQTAMSMGDFLLTTAISGGNQALALTIMGSGAAADTTLAAKDRGLDDWQAFTLGTVAGLAEALTEKFSIEALLDADLLKDSAIRYVLKNAFTEGAEEVASGAVNLMADILISQDKSQWEQSIQAYIDKENMDPDEAFIAAMLDQAQQLGLDFLGGALSGGIVGGGGVAINTATNAIGNRSQQGQTGRINDMDTMPPEQVDTMNQQVMSAPESATQEAQQVVNTDGAVTAENGNAILNNENVNGGTVNENIQQQPGESAAQQRSTTGAGVLYGGSQRNDGAGAGEPAGSVASRTGTAEKRGRLTADQLRTQNQRYALRENLRSEKVSSLSLGIQTGTENANLQEVPQEYWDEGMQAKAEQVYQETGKQVRYVLGQIQINGARGKTVNVRGVTTQEGIIVQADNFRYTAEQIADHESYHGMVQAYGVNLNRELIRRIRQKFTQKEFDNVVAAYELALREIIDVAGAGNGNEYELRMERLFEEILADAHAEMNAFGAGADQFTETVNQFLDENGITRKTEQSNGTAEPTGPPTEAASVDEAGEQYSAELSDEEWEKRYGLSLPTLETEDENIPIDKTTGNEENGITHTSTRGEQYDHRRIREGIAETAEGGAYYGETVAGGIGIAQETQKWGNLPEKIRSEVLEIVTDRVNNSPNADELYGYLLSLVGVSDETIDWNLYNKAISMVTEQIYDDAVNLHPVLFEDCWKIVGGNISALRSDILDCVGTAAINSGIYADGTAESYSAEEELSDAEWEQRYRLSLPTLEDAETETDHFAEVKISTEEMDRNIQKVANMRPVAKISGEEFAKGETDLVSQVAEFFVEVGNSAYNAQLGDVVLDRKGIKSDIAHGIGRKKAAAFAAVPDVIKQGLVVDYQKNWKGRGYDTAVVAAPITIGAEEHIAAVVLTRSNQTNRFYVHEVLTTKNGAMPFKTGTQNKGTPGGDAPSIFSILDKILAVKTNYGGTAERYSVEDDIDLLKGEGGEADFAELESRYKAENRTHKAEWFTEKLGEEGYQKYREYEKAKEAQQKQEARDKQKQKSREKARRISARAAENLQKLTEREEKERKALKPTKAKKELKRSVLDMFSIPGGQRAELGSIIDGYADRLLKNGRLTEEDRKAFFDRLYDSGVMTVQASEYHTTARSHIAKGRIYVSQRVKADFGDDWNEIRRRAFAAGVYLVDDRGAAGIDQWNATLAAEDMLPGLFNSEDTDERTILEKIIKVAEEGKSEKMSLAEYTAMLSEEGYVSEDEILDNMERQLDFALRTFVSNAGIELTVKESNIQENARLTRENIKQQARRAAEREERKESAHRQQARQELQELQKKTLKQLQWLSKNRNRAPEELRGAWDEVLGDIDLYAVGAADEMRWSNKYQATWKDLAQMYKDAMKNDPNFLPSKELEMIVTRLDGAKIEDMDLGALQDLYKAAIGLRTEFYNRKNVINDEMRRLFAEVYTDSKAEIEAAPGKFTGKFFDKLFNIEQLTPMNVLQRMGGWDPDGAFYSMAKQLERGERDMRAYTVKANRMLSDFLTEHEDWVKKADGQGKDAVWYELEVPQLLELGMGDKPIFGDTVKVYMTPAQKVHMYLESKNLDNLRHMTGGRTFADKELYSKGKRQEAFAQGKTIKLAPETVKQIVSDLTAEEMELAGILDRYYNTFATQEINQVSNILYGYDKAMGKNYAPIYTNRNYTKTEFGVFDTTAEGVGNLKEREFAVNPSYNISAFDGFERHVDQTARFCGMAIPARNWTTLMNWREKNNSTGDVITHKWGEVGKKYITDLITTLQAGDDVKTDAISSGLNKLQSNYITAIFGANPSIVLKQLGSIPMATAYLGIENIPSIAQISSIDRGLISKYTQDLEWRTMGYSSQETKFLKDNPNWTQTNKFYRFTFGGGAITAMDGWAASTLWPWAENKIRREHPELEIGTQTQVDAGESSFYKKVAEEFENAVARSQSTSDEIHQSRLRKSKNPLTRAFTLFRSDSAQTYNAIRQKIGEAQFAMRTGADDAAVKSKKKAAGAVFMALLLNAAWGEAVSFLMALWKNMGKNYRDDEDELTAEGTISEMVKNMIGSIAGTVTLGEELYEIVGNIITGEKWYGIDTPGMEQLNDVLEAITDSGKGMRDFVSGAADVLANGGNLGQYISQNSNDMIGYLKEIAKTAAMYFPGIPVSNIEAYLFGAVKWVCPELAAAYEDASASVGKNDLSGATGDVLEDRLCRLMRRRDIELSDETLNCLALLYEAGFTGSVPADIPSSVTIEDVTHDLGAYQQQAYGNIWNQIAVGAIEELTSSAQFAEMEPETQADALSRLYSYATAKTKAQMFDDYEVSSSVQKIDKLTEAGLSLAEGISWISTTAEEGLEKLDLWRLNVDYFSDVEDQLAALAVVMSNAQILNVEVANDLGVKPEVYVSFYEYRSQYDADGNGSLNQSEVKAIIDAKFSHLPQSQKAVLWQIANSSTKSAKNNPYSVKIGQEVLDAKAAAKG